MTRLFGEPRHSCPKIDNVLELVSKSENDIQSVVDILEDFEISYTPSDQSDFEHLKNELYKTIQYVVSKLHNAQDHLSFIPDLMEETRQINSDLRDWGSECYDLASEWEDKVSDLEEEIEKTRR